MNVGILELEKILKKINAGDENAFRAIFDYYYPQLCFFSNKIVNDRDAAEDVVQEVFIAFWKQTTSFVNVNALRAYLYNSVQNRSLNHLEKITSRNNLNNSQVQDTFTDDDYLRKQLETEVIQEIFEAIDELPEQCRNVFKMSYIQRYEVKQIAEDLNVSVNTVKTQRLRAKKYLKERLKNVFPVLLYLFLN